ncbi:MAG: tetratricopeptide repeat protein [Planctomycetia bacterium]|nr:tetratricopeptide repeat protein [Planctomycetia bacterium]
MITLVEALDLAVGHHQAGRLNEAETIYRQVLQVQPRNTDALHLLGRIEHQRGRPEQAAALFAQAIAEDGSQPMFFNNLGEALRAQGKIDEAAAAYREAVRLKPDYPQALGNLAIVLQAQGDLVQAESFFREAVRLSPNPAAAYNNLGTLLRQQERWPEAKACYQAAIRLQPDLAIAYNNLGNVFRHEKLLPEAIEAYQHALRLDGEYEAARFNLGLVLRQCGRFAEAATEFQNAVRLDPNNFEAYTNLGVLWNELGRAEEAINACRKAIELNPRNDIAYCNLGVFLMLQGQLDEALEYYRTAIQLAPEKAGQHGNLLYALNYHPALDPAKIFAEHRSWAERHADPLTAHSAPHANDRTTNRRLRVGYVSPNFRVHAVNFFSEPILACHDHACCEVFCYSDVQLADDATGRLQSYADHWREIVGLGDQEASELIRRDQIDILVDLTGHISGSRLLVFARKPAPVQVTYLGYQNTTGMMGMDYRLTDAWSDPPGTTDSFHTEELIRLPRSFFCYQPSADAPPVSSLPALASGYVTFGSFNSFAKVTPEVLSVWATILLAVPQSRLVLLAPLTERLRAHVTTSFERRGVSAQRLELCDRRAHKEYLELIQRVDIALDPFPFNGHTTTCDALWQGVPVVMLAGQTYASRFGSSALVTLGLNELIGSAREQYAEIAMRLAGNLGKLAERRANLRPLMARSPLVDFQGFTRHLEEAYRKMWIRWCTRQTA